MNATDQLDYKTALLEGIKVAMTCTPNQQIDPSKPCEPLSLAGLMGWHSVELDWPVDPALVRAWDEPVMFLQCGPMESEPQAIGSRAMHFEVMCLLVYPVSYVGEHMQDKAEAVQRLDSSILEQWFYYLDQHTELEAQLRDNFRDFVLLQQTAETSTESKTMAESMRPALIFTATVVVEQTVVGFSYRTFLQRVFNLKLKG